MCVNKREVAVVITLIQNLLIKLVVLFYYLVLKLSYVQYLLDSANINFVILFNIFSNLFKKLYSFVILFG